MKWIKIAYYWLQMRMARSAFEYNRTYYGDSIYSSDDHFMRTVEAMDDMNKYYMKYMKCKGSGCMNCQGYDAPDLIARGEGPDTLSPEEIRAVKADIVYLDHMQDTRRGIYCCERGERLGRMYPCPDCQ